MSNWFTSDQHFGHENIIEFALRPFKDVFVMNETLVQKWNAVVQPEDTVWVLGDTCMGKKKETLRYIERLIGTKKFLPGNHDAPWIGRSSGETLKKWRDAYLAAGFDEIIDTGAQYGEPTIQIGTHTVKMSHFPYISDEFERGQSEDRFSPWRPDDDGSWLLHGHIHNSWADNHRMINVGVDVRNFTPMHEDEVLELITLKELHVNVASREP